MTRWHLSTFYYMLFCSVWLEESSLCKRPLLLICSWEDCANRTKAESCNSSRQNCCAKFYGEKGSAEKYYIKGCLSTKGCHSFELNSKCDFEIANCAAVKVICVMVPHGNTNGQRHAKP